MATFVFFDAFKDRLGQGDHELDANSFRIVLTNSAPNVDTWDELADVTQISNGNGYTTGGNTLSSVTWSETSAGSGVWRFSSADSVWTAAGGSIGPFRYVVLYNDTATNDPLVGYLDYGSSITVTDTNTFTVDVGANGWFELDG
jgi:hypothetical protein